MLLPRLPALTLCLSLLAGCQTNDLATPPPPLGDFVLGINVASPGWRRKACSRAR